MTSGSLEKIFIILVGNRVAKSTNMALSPTDNKVVKLVVFFILILSFFP
jgi:hypothetical protein